MEMFRISAEYPFRTDSSPKRKPTANSARNSRGIVSAGTLTPMMIISGISTSES